MSKEDKNLSSIIGETNYLNISYLKSIRDKNYELNSLLIKDKRVKRSKSEISLAISTKNIHALLLLDEVGVKFNAIHLETCLRLGYDDCIRFMLDKGVIPNTECVCISCNSYERDLAAYLLESIRTNWSMGYDNTRYPLEIYIILNTCFFNCSKAERYSRLNLFTVVCIKLGLLKKDKVVLDTTGEQEFIFKMIENDGLAELKALISNDLAVIKPITASSILSIVSLLRVDNTYWDYVSKTSIDKSSPLRSVKPKVKFSLNLPTNPPKSVVASKAINREQTPRTETEVIYVEANTPRANSSKTVDVDTFSSSSEELKVCTPRSKHLSSTTIKRLQSNTYKAPTIMVSSLTLDVVRVESPRPSRVNSKDKGKSIRSMVHAKLLNDPISEYILRHTKVESLVSLYIDGTQVSRNVLLAEAIIARFSLDPNYNNGEYITLCARTNSCDLLKFLMDIGGDPRINTDMAIVVACENENVECLSLLLSSSNYSLQAPAFKRQREVFTACESKMNIKIQKTLILYNPFRESSTYFYLVACNSGSIDIACGLCMYLEPYEVNKGLTVALDKSYHQLVSDVLMITMGKTVTDVLRRQVAITCNRKLMEQMKTYEV